MRFDAFSIVGYCWIALGSLWLAGLPFAKPVARRQPSGARIFQLLLGALGFTLLGSHWLRDGWMGLSFLPHTEPVRHDVQFFGLALTIAGCLIAAWARVVLGGNWSGAATVKASHELIVKGPYAFARHPIYTGLLVAVVGTALVVGEWRSIVGTMVILLAFFVKMSQEERLMLQTFPEAYPHYRQKVRALIPGLF
ncbi:MAG TPA: isoprenylcysteine carboxylmethyltransferase family protein [Terracidiphilus sp.]|nr:isoprenylcysteine carboxylmethyltransferase family protein [Terracidiphilus sp.]